MQEDGMNGSSAEVYVDIVTELQTKQVAIEGLALLAVIDEQQHMTHTLVASDEAGRHDG